MSQAAKNALALLRQFTSPQGADNLPHFDSAGFFAEMENRAATLGRTLAADERIALQLLIALYCTRAKVVQS